MTAIALYADLPQMLKALVNFRWEFLPLILGLTLFNYFWRFIKWQYYLGRLEIHVHWFKSLLIFLSGLSMAITPGKIGELLKAYLLKNVNGRAYQSLIANYRSRKAYRRNCYDRSGFDRPDTVSLWLGNITHAFHTWAGCYSAHTKPPTFIDFARHGRTNAYHITHCTSDTHFL